MKKNFISLLCSIMCCTMAFSQLTVSSSTTAFQGCPGVYVVGYKNGSNCVASPYMVNTISLDGNTISSLFTLPSTSLELNGIGISRIDNRGYALLFDRTPQTTASTCAYSNIRLLRFGANGAYEVLGSIATPTGINIVTPLGAVDGSSNYYFGAVNNAGTQFYVGKITNLNTLSSGSITPIPATYTPVTTLCGAAYADFAVNPLNNNELITYGIYNDRANGGTTTSQRPTGTLMRISLTTQTVTCYGTQTYNPAFFTDTSDDNFAGIMYGADGLLYGMNVKDRKVYKIDPTTGAISYSGMIGGGGELRGDLGSCASFNTSTIPTPFTCPGSYLISYKQGTNCTALTNSIYTITNYQTGTINPTPIYTTPDTSTEVNAIGISKLDGLGYGFMYRRYPIPGTGAADCAIDTLKFFRFGANGVVQILGYILRPSNTALDLSSALGCMNSNGTYYFLASANYQAYLAKIQRTDTLTEIPNRQIPFTYNAIQATCIRTIADWAISPTTGALVSYGIYTNGSNQVAGSMVSLDVNTYALTCYGQETTGVFTNAGQDNFGGILYGADAYMYGVNVYTKKYYKINPATGAITEINTVPAAYSTIRTDMASCITDLQSLPLGFEKPTVTSLGECRAALSFKVSGVEIGDAFTVEKSFDGVNFTTLTTLKATTEGTNTYDVIDSKTGITNYYRIKGVSKGGDIKYSPIVRFLSSCGGKNNVTLFQNLLSGTTTVSGEVSLYKSQVITATVFNTTGVKVYSKTSTATAGVSRFNYEIPSLTKGVYLLQTVIGEERFTEKFIVQ